MHPILLECGPMTLHYYGLMVALGYLAAISFAVRAAPQVGLKKELVLDAAFYIIIFSIIGGRLLYVSVEFPYYLENPLEIIMLHHGGSVYWGGFIFSAPLIYLWLRRQRVNPWDFADLVAPHVALGHAIGRIGCFLNGCCYGTPTDAWWGTVFPVLHDQVSRVPIQLVSSAVNLGLFFVLSWMLHSTSREAAGASGDECEASNRAVAGLSRLGCRFRGQVFWSYVLLYSILRFTIEFWRDDSRGGIPGTQLSTSQVICVVGVALGVYILVKGSKKKEIGEKA